MEELNFSNVMMNNYKKFLMKSCRTCSLVIKDSICIDFELNAKLTSLHDKLYSCCPEFDLRLNSKTILCLNCSKIINIVYEFIHKYDKSKALLHSNSPFSLPFIPNVHLFNNFDVTTEDEIKTEEINLSDTESSSNLYEQIQSTKNTQKYLQSNMKRTVCIVERSSKHSQYNDAIYKTVSKESSFIDPVEGQLKYSYCNYGSTKNDNFKKHGTHTEHKSFKCLHCIYTTAHKYYLVRHFRTHAGHKPFKCSHCVYSTAHKNCLVRHIRTHTGDKPYKCTQCDFRTARRRGLIDHFRTHTGDKPYKCSQCDFKTARRCDLINHFRTHTGEKPYKCSQCNFKSARKSDLLIHFRTHTGDKPFKCFHCDYSTAHKKCLVKHFHTHTGDKPYKCSHCDYSTAYKESLVNHFRTHTGDKPYKCSDCDYSSAHKKCLVKHFRTHIGD